MIICNLKNILKEMDINVLKFSQITGISRLTISNLCNNSSGGIQFETLDRILRTLNIPFDVLFSFMDIEYKVENSKLYISFSNQVFEFNIVIKNDNLIYINYLVEKPFIPLSQNKFKIAKMEKPFKDVIQNDICLSLGIKKSVFIWNYQ